MKRTIPIGVALVLILSAGAAFAQGTPNAPRKFEISYTGNLPFFLGIGFVKKGSARLGGACLQVAVRVVDSAAVVGEFCGTHQFVASPQSSQSNGGKRNPRWWLSESGKQVDSLASVRGGMRFSQRTGSHLTTFVQGLAGFETGYRHGGFADNSGFSLAAGGGLDVNLKDWLALEIARVNYQMTRVGETTVNGLRFGTGFVGRIGKVSDQSK